MCWWIKLEELSKNVKCFLYSSKQLAFHVSYCSKTETNMMLTCFKQQLGKNVVFSSI